MKTLFLEKGFTYDGSQLRSLFGYLDHRVLGDSIIAWVGPCRVELDHMVDGEDKLSNSQICGDEMLHFVVEKFGEGLSYGVSMQRLMAAITKDVLVEMKEKNAGDFRREGDDVFWQDKKFSISIATVSPVSAMIHFAVNVRNEGTPVSTCALEDFGLESEEFAKTLLHRFEVEFQAVEEATQKVHWVR